MPEYRNQLISVKIGSSGTALTGVVYYADKLTGSGPGGVTVGPRFVANTINAVGVTIYHCNADLEFGIEDDEGSAIISSGFSVPGTVIDSIVVTEKSTTGKTRTVTYTNSYITSLDYKLENLAEHQIYVCKVIVTGTRTMGSWA